jgi:urease accessory protein
VAAWHISCLHIPTTTKVSLRLIRRHWPGQGARVGEQVSVAQQRRPNEGALRLVLRRAGQRTVLQECYFQVPLQVLRPVYLDDRGTAYIYLVSPCGGVVGGDVHTMAVVVESGAHVCLTTPSATKLYATHGTPARQRLDITLQAGAVLEYLPEQIIPFAQAAFQQQTTVRLGAGACVLLMEIVAPGRLARGEAFAYRDYDSSVCLETASGQVLLRERTRLRPGWQRLDGPGLFEGYYYLGMFYALVEGMSLSAELAEHLHALLACRAGLLGSASLLAHGGIAVRVLGVDHTTVSQALHEVWDVLRRALLGYPAVVWRK